MPEPLILKVQADTKGVPEGLNKVARGAENLDISARKASSAVKGFVQDLAQAKNGADVASAALSGFSRILGSSIAATAIVIAGKAVIDTFSNISKTVEDSRDRIAKASKEIKDAGLDITFSQAANEAKRLSDEANLARENIEKLDKGFLSNLISTITGAREELEKLAKEADKLSQQRLLEGARSERKRAEETRGLEGGEAQIQNVKQRLAQELRPIDLTTPEGMEAAKELVKKAEADINEIRQKSFDEYDKKQAQSELRGYEADISGAEAARKIAERSDQEASQRAEDRQKRMDESRVQKEMDKIRAEERLESLRTDLSVKQLDLEDQAISARRRVVEAEGRVAEITSRAGGTLRGPGQRPTSFELGAERAAQRAFEMEQRRMAAREMEEIAEELYYKSGDPARKVSRFDVQRELAKRRQEAAKQQARDPYEARDEARQQAQATEKTLQQVRDNLKKVLDELKTYAHAT